MNGNNEDVQEQVEAAEFLSCLVDQLTDLSIAVAALARSNPPRNVTAREALALARVCEAGQEMRGELGDVCPEPCLNGRARDLQKQSNPISLDAARTALAMFGNDMDRARDWLLYRDPAPRGRENQ